MTVIFSTLNPGRAYSVEYENPCDSVTPDYSGAHSQKANRATGMANVCFPIDRPSATGTKQPD
jgi:hypothetical protein